MIVEGPKARFPVVACALFASVYGALGLARYWTFHSRSLDMAYYVRLVWGMAHGHPDNPVVGARHWLGLHLEPALLPIAWLSRLGLPIAELLLVLQAVFAALALLPIHSLARRRLAPVCGERVALAAALAIYLVPTVTRCLDYDFHPSTMLLLPLCAWIDAVDRADHRRAWLWLAVSLSFREDVGLQLAACALTFVVAPRADSASIARRRARRWTLGAQALVGVLWFAIYAFMIQPRFLPEAASGSFGAHFERFGGGAGGVAGVLGAALAHPLELARYLCSGDRLAYVPLLLLTVGVTALGAPRWLAGALPVVAINLLSDFPGVRRVESHYATQLAPFLVAAAIVGAARIGHWLGARQPGWQSVPATVLVLAATISWWQRGASPGSPDATLAAYRQDDFARTAAAEVQRLQGAPRVVAEVRLLAHLAERPEPLLDPAQRLYWKK